MLGGEFHLLESDMNPTHFLLVKFFYALVLFAGLSYFFHQVWRRALHICRAAPMNRFDRIGARILGVIKYYFGQNKLFHGYLLAGLMHALIFWGFWVVSVNTIHLVMGGFVTGSHLAWLGPEQPLGVFYIACRDGFEVIVLAMVALAGLRRLLTRPERLTYSYEAHLILILIALLMVTDFFINGAIAAEGVPHRASFIENSIGLWMTGMPWAKALGVASWWVHLFAILYFLNLLPAGKHFHVVTSFFSIFFRRLDPPGLRKMDLEEAETFGAGTIYEHGWKYLLDSYSCTDCGRCQDNCPTFITGKELNPKAIMTDIRGYLYANQGALLEGKAEGESGMPAFLGETISHQRIWDCTTCGACEEFCPLIIEHLGPILDSRRHLVMEEADFPDELGGFFRNLETQGNPWGIGQGNRTAWTEGLNVPIMADNPDTEILLWAGCSTSFDARNKKIVRSLVKCLNAADIKFAYLGLEETCNGDAARRAGHEYLFQMMAESVVETISKYEGIKQIITPCPHCFNVFKNEYPELGLKLEVDHHGTLLSRLVKSGRLKATKRLDHGRVAFHDSCYLGRYNGEFDAPRSVLGSLSGVHVVEAERHHEKGMCCGAGGARMFMEEKHGTRINQTRIEQLRANNPAAIATSCPFCMTMLGDAIKETGAEDDLKIMDIAEVLAEGLE